MSGFTRFIFTLALGSGYATEGRGTASGNARPNAVLEHSAENVPLPWRKALATVLEKEVYQRRSAAFLR